jgi:Fic family protein
MHKPATPPSFADLLGKLTSDPERFTELVAHFPRTGPSHRYLPWDEFRRRPAPEGISHEEWWFVVKLARQSMRRRLPLTDKDGRDFTYALPDEVLRGIEAVNRDASGHIAISEQVTNPATRDRYLVSSLIEEAITSSQLEGAATTRRVAKEMIRSGRPPQTRDERMILNNYSAMRHIGDLRTQRLSPELIYEIHRIVTEDTLDDPTASGRCQSPDEERVGVWDGDQLLHEPPPAATLPARLQVLCDFANDETGSEYVPPVVRAITLHFMLGYDHPFQDGNGRTARALFYWAMLNRGYWLTEFLSISRILKAAPAQYARSFLHTEQDDNDLTYFILYQLQVIQRSILELHNYLDRKIRDLQEIRRNLASMPGAFNHRQLVVLQHAMSNSDAQYTVQSHMNSHRVVHETARKDLLELQHRGLLERHRFGKAFVWVPAPDLSVLLKQRRTRRTSKSVAP